MAIISISEAAKLVEKNRTTVLRYIKSGRLSASKDKGGAWLIDTAELVRVFGDFKASESADIELGNPDPRPDQDKSFVDAIEILRDQLKAAHSREVKLLAMLEAEQAARRQLEQKLLPPGEIPKKGFWARLFSK